MAEASRVRITVAYVAISFIWGSTYLAIKVGLESFGPFFFAGMRYVVATLVAFAIARWRGIAFVGPWRRWLPAFGVGVLFIGVCNGLVFWAETRLDSAFTALLITANTVVAAVLTPLVPDERRLRLGGWFGVVVGFAGTFLILAPWKTASVELAAALAVLGSTVVWAATSLWVRRIRRRFEPFALTVAQMAAGALTLLVLAGVAGRPVVAPVTWRALAALAYLVVFGSLVAFSAYFYLLRHMEAARVATSTYINPVVAMVLGWLVLDERITWNMIVGVAVVLAGVALVMREESSSPATVPREEADEP